MCTFMAFHYISTYKLFLKFAFFFKADSSVYKKANIDHVVDCMFWLFIYSLFITYTHTLSLPVVLARRTTADFCAMSAKRPVIGILCVFMYNEDEREKTFFFLCRGGMYSAHSTWRN
jgi:hypothetical protein